MRIESTKPGQNAGFQTFYPANLAKKAKISVQAANHFNQDIYILLPDHGLEVQWFPAYKVPEEYDMLY